MIPKELLKIRRKPPRRRIRRHPCYVCGDDVRPWLKPSKPPIQQRLVCASCARCIESLAQRLREVRQQTNKRKAEEAYEKAITCGLCGGIPNAKGEKEEVAAAVLRHTWRHLRPLRGAGRYFVPEKFRFRSRWHSPRRHNQASSPTRVRRNPVGVT